MFQQSRQWWIKRLPWNCWVQEYSTVLVNQIQRSHDWEGCNCTLKHVVQLLPLLQLLLDNHSVEDWMREGGCRTIPGLHGHASSRNQAKASGARPLSYFCLPDLKPMHLFGQNRFCKAVSTEWQVWVPIHHIQRSKGYGFHILGMSSIRLYVY